ncbi:MAG: hypothetical protein K5776_09325 [Lachnospiraceae bacterium]|nr:hypothetical protein [Lachnospiraceae bacterium]
MKQKLTHNLNLKVLAVLFSIIIWVIVVNIDDPVKNVQFDNVPIRVKNENLLTKQNKVYEIEPGQEYVDVTVSGRRSVIEEISKENIDAVADMSSLDDSSCISIKATSNKYADDIVNIKLSFDKVKLNIEDLKKIQKIIQVETIGNPADEYIKGNYSLSLNRVNIEGPKSIIDLVQTAKVQIDVEGATNSVSASAPIVLYDAQGQIIDSSRLKMNIDNISVSQEILYTKTVSLACVPSGEAAEGYKANGVVVLNPSEIKLAGPKSVLDNINTINIPSNVVNISEQTSSYRTSVNVFNYLPSGLESCDDDFRGNVLVTVGIEKEIEKVYNIYTTRIDLNDVPDGFKAEIVNGAESVTDNRVELKVHGLSKDFENVTAANINLKADFNKWIEENNVENVQAGIYSIPVKVDLPDKLETEDTVRLRIKIYKEEET